MKYCFYIICFFFTLQLSSQTWFPTGAEWHYGTSSPSSPSWGYVKWSSLGDSMILGKNCKILQQTYGLTYKDYFGKRVYLYESNDSVFLWNKYFNQFSLLYDFNALKDSSWTFYNDSCSFLITVDSVYTTSINSFQLKTMHLNYSFGTIDWSYKIYEFIGGNSNPFPGLYDHCYGSISDVLTYGLIRCYQDSIIGFHQFDTIACTYNSVKEYINQQVKIYPNPAHEKIKIEGFENVKGQISIYDIYGKLCKQVSIERDGEIDISSLKKGMYFIQIYQGEKSYRGTFFKL